MSQGLVAPKQNPKLDTKNSVRSVRAGFRISSFEFRPLLPWAAAALSGLLLVACFPKIHFPGLAWIACFPLLVALSNEKRVKQAFLLGYLCGAFFFAGSCYWFVIVMQYYGHLAPALAVLVLILFVVIDATFFGGFGLFMGLAARRSPGWALGLSPFLWMAMELARTYLITGFPWNLLGYGVQAPGVRQIASVTGVYGLSFLAVATSALVGWVLLSPRRTRAGLALVGWLALLFLAQWRLAPPATVMGKDLAILVQPNVPLDDAELENWAPWKDSTQLLRLIQFSIRAVERSLPAEASKYGSGPAATRIRRDATRDIRAGLRPGGTDSTAGVSSPASVIEKAKLEVDNPTLLLIWAENPAPFFFTRDAIFRDAMENMARQTHAFVIANTIIPVDAKGEEITNSAFTLDPEGREVSRYDKIHLVPFGEYVPWWAFPGWVHKITFEVGNFVPGTSYSVAKSSRGGIGVFICYEAIIPQLARRLVANGAGVLVNISNDAWYGDSAAAYQHLEMARLRAIENHRYLLRATNNGLTALIDPYGRVLKEIPRYQRLFLPAHFDFETRMTFYSAHGDVFAWLCAVLAALMVAFPKLRVKD